MYRLMFSIVNAQFRESRFWSAEANGRFRGLRARRDENCTGLAGMHGHGLPDCPPNRRGSPFFVVNRMNANSFV